MRALISKARLRFGAPKTPELYYIAPGVNWSLDWDGYYITHNIQKQFGLPAHISASAKDLSGQIVHYGSLWDIDANLDEPHTRRNQIVGTVFHGEKQHSVFKKAFEHLIAKEKFFSKIHVANRIMESRLLDWGIPREKLVRIPLGVDMARFVPASPEQKRQRRLELGISKNVFCIGSFHKDGVGMQEGNEPKPIKGPDVFLDVVQQVNKQRPVFVLLSAPARGYVKRGLNAIGVPYKHIVMEDYLEIPSLYHVLDMYLITSREEGGPKGVLEAMAAGIPVVATKVGLVPDVIDHDQDGLLAESEDASTLSEHIIRLFDDSDLRTRLAANGLQIIKTYDWPLIAARYYSEIYKPLLVA